MVTDINSGEPVLLIYGILLIALITSCAAISLGELVSSMPNASAQSFWATELATPRYANFAGYLTGCFAWAGRIFTISGVALAMATAVAGLYQLTHDSLRPKRGMLLSYTYKVSPKIRITPCWETVS
jgi:choline transport protein